MPLALEMLAVSTYVLCIVLSEKWLVDSNDVYCLMNSIDVAHPNKGNLLSLLHSLSSLDCGGLEVLALIKAYIWSPSNDSSVTKQVYPFRCGKDIFHIWKDVENKKIPAASFVQSARISFLIVLQQKLVESIFLIDHGDWSHCIKRRRYVGLL